MIKDVNWHKYLAELCNIQIGDYWGRFSTSSNINTSVKEKSIVISLQHPLLIVPANVLAFQDVVVINGRP